MPNTKFTGCVAPPGNVITNPPGSGNGNGYPSSPQPGCGTSCSSSSNCNRAGGSLNGALTGWPAGDEMQYYYKVGPESTFPNGASAVYGADNSTLIVGPDGSLVLPSLPYPATTGCNGDKTVYQACAFDVTTGVGPICGDTQTLYDPIGAYGDIGLNSATFRVSKY